MQIVGLQCDSCNKKIDISIYATYCIKCQKAFHLECIKPSFTCPTCGRMIQDELTKFEQEEKTQHKKRWIPLRIQAAWLIPLLLFPLMYMLFALWPSLRNDVRSVFGFEDNDIIVQVDNNDARQIAIESEMRSLNQRASGLNRKHQSAQSRLAASSALLESGAADLSEDLSKYAKEDLRSIQDEMPTIAARKKELMLRKAALEDEQLKQSQTQELYKSIGMLFLLFVVVLWLTGFFIGITSFIEALCTHSLRKGVHSLAGLTLSLGFGIAWFFLHLK